MKTPGEYISYFTTLADAHLQIKSFFEGDYDEILAAERSTMVYPLLWVESPEISIPEDEDGFMLHFDGAFVVLYNSTLEDTARRKTNMETAFRIAYDIVMKMLTDSINEAFSFSIKNIRIDPVTTVNNDNDHGWRVSFTVSSQTDGCENDVWSKSIPTHIFARFEISGVESSLVTLLNTSDTDPSFAYDIIWEIHQVIDGEPVITSIPDEDEIEFTVNRNCEMIFIKMILDYGGYQKVASLFIPSPNPAEGMKSVPFIYNPIM